MPVKKILLRSGVNRENTRYTTEGGFYECNKIRFRQGTPEVIGGWQPVSNNTYLGLCRSLWNWITLSGLNLVGVGTHLKFYIENGGAYYDTTPLRITNVLSNPFSTVSGSKVVTVTDSTANVRVGEFVTFTNASTVGGLDLNASFQVQSIPTASTYTILASSNALATVTNGGGTSVNAYYEIRIGSSISIPAIGWGAGAWGAGTWGRGTSSNTEIRIWNQANFGQDLIYGPRNGPMYYWNAAYGYYPKLATITIASPAVISTSFTLVNGMALTLYTTGTLPTGLTPGTVYYVVNASGVTGNLAATPGGTPITTTGSQTGSHTISTRGVPLTALAGASDVPTVQSIVLVSDASRFVLAFGANDYGSTEQDPMLIRWSNQESAVDWTPTDINQAGSLRLSHGSRIVTTVQTRQEIVTITDSSVYSLQYLGPPIVWGSQLLADNISIAGPNVAAAAAGVVFWMGVDKFYKYEGQVKTLRCDLKQFVFSDINLTQADQFFAGNNEGFNEVWWFYCSANSTTVDRYVVYNYLEDVWYYGTMTRTAWMDSGLRDHPIAATYNYTLVNHESGLNDNETGVDRPIEAYVLSSEFDIDDGHQFGFIWRILPDMTFRGSTADSPTATMYLYGLQNSGSGYNARAVSMGKNYEDISRTAVVPIEQFTGQINIRVRGRQLAFKVYSNQLNTTWQLGAPRFDIRPDGRR